MLSAGKTYEITYSQELGRYMVATKDLEMGEIIFEEIPLICAPVRGSKLICPGCYKTTDEGHRCEKCDWLICSPECHKSSIHRVECNIVQRISPRNKSQKIADWQALSDGFMLVLCLSLKTLAPDKWEQIWKMETNWDQWARSPLYKQADNTVKIIRENYEIPPEIYSTDEIFHIQAVLDINAYEIRLPEANIQASYIWPA